MADHEVIYLSPLCDGCNDYEGRLWCKDDQGPCEECGAEWVKYVVASGSANLENCTKSERGAETAAK